MTHRTDNGNRPTDHSTTTVDVDALRTSSEARARAAALRAELDTRPRQFRQSTVRLQPRAAEPTVEELADLRTRAEAAESRADNLERALASNRRIGMAIGILLTRLHCSEEQAFEVLRRESMRRNVKVAQLAEQVVYTGTL